LTDLAYLKFENKSRTKHPQCF